MNYSEYRLSLDIHKSAHQAALAMKKGDTRRRIYIRLTEGCVPYVISEDCFAVFTAAKADGKVIFNQCKIEKNTVIYDVTEQTTAAPGQMPCEIRVYSKDGGLLTSARFLVMVEDTIYDEESEIESTDEFSALTTALGEVIDIRDQWKALLDSGPSTVTMSQKLVDFDGYLQDLTEQDPPGIPVADLLAEGGYRYMFLVVDPDEREGPILVPSLETVKKFMAALFELEDISIDKSSIIGITAPHFFS